MNQLVSFSKHVTLVAPFLLVALCGCGGSSASNDPAPTISSLSITPGTVSVGQSNTLTGSVLVADTDGDEVEIDATITAPGGASATLPPTMIQGAAGVTSATVSFTLLLVPPAAGKYEIGVFVKDTEGKSSNTLTTSITAQ